MHYYVEFDGTDNFANSSKFKQCVNISTAAPRSHKEV